MNFDADPQIRDLSRSWNTTRFGAPLALQGYCVLSVLSASMRKSERIVLLETRPVRLLETGPVRRIRHVAEDGEAGIRGTLQRSRGRAVLVTPEDKGAVGLEPEDLIHYSRRLS